ncbi:hypothetical protein SAMN02745857_01963 [Andreprevotia lacus DSM 23236]|uniref:Class I SAM-dependent methyltransferase n=1 Tax=Andreprevotia lacus DSM 23236 TaxID=1121001 RepID=A0A1W1XMN2_9NEIS|nr:class I SAM-dependent methyltransferase [Andreprevotia lacus]SMC24788.1 hypothetical protein SAMN02745857_01963 [Andreprevotia lacus DSM 23236]
MILRFLLPQLAGFTLGLSAAYGLRWPAIAGAALAALLALVFSRLAGAGQWWQLALQALLPFALLGALALHWPAWWWAVAFVLCWLVYAGALRNRVPLYLSNARALALLSEHIPAQARFVDLGAGTGTVLAWLARHRTDVAASGIEFAWLPYWLGRLRLWRTSQRLLRGDLFALPLADYDVVYAYLSPEPMAQLWAKARAEMKPGALLVSNSFAVPGHEPDLVLPVQDWKESELLLWRL